MKIGPLSLLSTSLAAALGVTPMCAHPALGWAAGTPAQPPWVPVFSLIKSGYGRQAGMLPLPITETSWESPPDCPRLRRAAELTRITAREQGAVGEAGVGFRQWLS